MPIKVKIVPSVAWVHTETSQRVSIYGALPWTCPADMKYWEKREVGWTVYNINESTYGFGRPPFATREGIEAFLKAHPDHFQSVEDGYTHPYHPAPTAPKEAP